MHHADSPQPTPSDTRRRSGGSPIVRFVGVNKSFGRQRVLRGLDLEFNEGQTTVVLGPSGSGKSVILKHIVGLMKPDTGQIWYRDQRVDLLTERQLAPLRRETGFLFQLSALFDSMSIAENLEFPLTEHTTLKPDERRARIEAALAVVDLRGVEKKFPAQLSGGQQRRAALARSVILRPSLMLYDEPTTGLDPIRSDGIAELIVKLQRETGLTSVVVTHDLACMRKVADRVVMLYEGRIIVDGTPEDLDRSTDPHVQHFITGTAEDDVDREPADEHHHQPAPGARSRA
ncbi:MAG: ABC transporter ATP-binding protein [Planctomycetota bacterium]|nr:ABC transporter ATP-binding protein [Planctomycetota bacterium]